MFKTLKEKRAQWKAYKTTLKEKNAFVFFVVDTIEALLVALVFALLIRQFILQVSLVPTGSMIPTMAVGDRLFVNKYVYDYRVPTRGEIVVFKSPYKDKKDYVKRCIGLPGETLEIKKGIVFINNKQLIFAGVNINRDYSFYGPVTIPKGHYFLMGDNRGNSLDSRVYGFVPEKNLIGKALFTFWPVKRMQWLH